MRCRCGNEIENVAEHLKDLAEWLCKQCTNTMPKSQQLPIDIEPYSQRTMGGRRRKKDAEADAA